MHVTMVTIAEAIWMIVMMEYQWEHQVDRSRMMKEKEINNELGVCLYMHTCVYVHVYNYYYKCACICACVCTYACIHVHVSN